MADELRVSVGGSRVLVSYSGFFCWLLQRSLAFQGPIVSDTVALKGPTIWALILREMLIKEVRFLGCTGAAEFKFCARLAASQLQASTKRSCASWRVQLPDLIEV